MSDKKIVRTRFAPSPTGYLHIGGARTALFAWLYARHHGGTFILRIEDTDRERSTPESIEAIKEAMQWLGLDYDEGPFYQTERFDRYQEVLDQLLGAGSAYYCECSKERLDALREAQMARKEKPRYDGCCRDKKLSQDAGASQVVRFRNPESGAVTFQDSIRGPITVQNSELDDLIIARSDGTPTYNFTVVVDDWDMKITHVIRGDDHINNTPRQMNILNALGADLPVYAHVPTILGPDGKRLSKRHGAVSVLHYRDVGYLPEAMLNGLVRLGWSDGDQEVFSREEMIAEFDLAHVSHSPARFDEGKLMWLNQHYLKSLDSEALVPLFKAQLEALGVDSGKGPDLKAVIAVQVERSKTLVDMAESSRYFFEDTITYDEKAVRKHLKQATVPMLTLAREKMAALENWTAEELHRIILEVAEALDLKLGKVGQPLRVAVTGNTISPSLDVTLALIGQARVVQRLGDAQQQISESV